MEWSLVNWIGKKGNEISGFQMLTSVLYFTAANQSPEEETKTRSFSKYFSFSIFWVLSCTERTQWKHSLKSLAFVQKFCFSLLYKSLNLYMKGWHYKTLKNSESVSKNQRSCLCRDQWYSSILIVRSIFLSHGTVHV